MIRELLKSKDYDELQERIIRLVENREGVSREDLAEVCEWLAQSMAAMAKVHATVVHERDVVTHAYRTNQDNGLRIAREAKGLATHLTRWRQKLSYIKEVEEALAGLWFKSSKIKRLALKGEQFKNFESYVDRTADPDLLEETLLKKYQGLSLEQLSVTAKKRADEQSPRPMLVDPNLS